MDIMTKDYARQRVSELEAIAVVRPTSTVLADLAACYFTLDDPTKALPLAERAWQKNKNPGIGMNLALILKDLGRHDESFHVIEEAYWLNSDDFYIRLGYGEALLKAGFWSQAWKIYDNARPTQQGAACDLRLPGTVREWHGEALEKNHKLLVINEGGTGDRISYARWLPELTKRGIDWAFYPYDELFSFFERLFPRERLVKDGENSEATHWATTFSLPAKLNVGPTQIPSPLTVTATREKIEKYEIIRTDDLPIIGLCYEAAEKFQGDRKVRSMSEGQAMRLVCMTGDKIHWVNLQHGKVMPFPVSHLPFESWEDTAGLIHNLDAVVTVDTGTMHLAGAMGKQSAVLLSANSCWKFLRAGKKLNLYPTATFYRNKDRGFETAISELVTDIRQGVWPCKP